jgi:hypothetical protein
LHSTELRWAILVEEEKTGDDKHMPKGRKGGREGEGSAYPPAIRETGRGGRGG